MVKINPMAIRHWYVLEKLGYPNTKQLSLWVLEGLKGFTVKIQLETLKVKKVSLYQWENARFRLNFDSNGNPSSEIFLPQKHSKEEQSQDLGHELGHAVLYLLQKNKVGFIPRVETLTQEELDTYHQRVFKYDELFCERFGRMWADQNKGPNLNTFLDILENENRD